MAHDDLNGLSTAVAHRRLSDTIRRFLAEEESLKKSSLHPFLSVRFLRERPLCPLGFAAGMLGVLDATLGTRRDPTAALTQGLAVLALSALAVWVDACQLHRGRQHMRWKLERLLRAELFQQSPKSADDSASRSNDLRAVFGSTSSVLTLRFSVATRRDGRWRWVPRALLVEGDLVAIKHAHKESRPARMRPARLPQLTSRPGDDFPIVLQRYGLFVLTETPAYTCLRAAFERSTAHPTHYEPVTASRASGAASPSLGSAEGEAKEEPEAEAGYAGKMDARDEAVDLETKTPVPTRTPMHTQLLSFHRVTNAVTIVAVALAVLLGAARKLSLPADAASAVTWWDALVSEPLIAVHCILPFAVLWPPLLLLLEIFSMSSLVPTQLTEDFGSTRRNRGRAPRSRARGAARGAASPLVSSSSDMTQRLDCASSLRMCTCGPRTVCCGCWRRCVPVATKALSRECHWFRLLFWRMAAALGACGRRAHEDPWVAGGSGTAELGQGRGRSGTGRDGKDGPMTRPGNVEAMKWEMELEFPLRLNATGRPLLERAQPWSAESLVDRDSGDPRGAARRARIQRMLRRRRRYRYRRHLLPLPLGVADRLASVTMLLCIDPSAVVDETPLVEEVCVQDRASVLSTSAASSMSPRSRRKRMQLQSASAVTILDMHPMSHKSRVDTVMSRAKFEDTNWRKYLSSLRPLGLSCLLHSSPGLFRRLDYTYTQGPEQGTGGDAPSSPRRRRLPSLSGPGRQTGSPFSTSSSPSLLAPGEPANQAGNQSDEAQQRQVASDCLASLRWLMAGIGTESDGHLGIPGTPPVLLSQRGAVLSRCIGELAAEIGFVQSDTRPFRRQGRIVVIRRPATGRGAKCRSNKVVSSPDNRRGDAHTRSSMSGSAPGAVGIERWTTTDPLTPTDPPLLTYRMMLDRRTKTAINRRPAAESGSRVSTEAEVEHTSQMMVAGDPLALLLRCSDVWDGEALVPLGRQHRRALVTLAKRWHAEDLHTIGFAYRPMLPRGPVGICRHTFPELQAAADPTTVMFSLQSISASRLRRKKNSGGGSPSSGGGSPGNSRGATKDQKEEDSGKRVSSPPRTESPEDKTTRPTGRRDKGQAGEDQSGKAKTNGVDAALQELVLLGMVAARPQPKPGVQALVENLHVAGVRFVFFSWQDFYRAKPLAAKMGLDTGWNTAISLRADSDTQRPNDLRGPDTEMNTPVSTPATTPKMPTLPLTAAPDFMLPPPAGNAEETPTASLVADATRRARPRRTSSMSSIDGDVKLTVDGSPALANSFTDAEKRRQSGKQQDEWDHKARLPHGVEEIKHHLEEVDNVPLLVSLFTDATPESIREMMTVMQSHGEVLCALGSDLHAANARLFALADVAMRVHQVEMPSRLDEETLLTPQSDMGMLRLLPTRAELNVSSQLNSLGCPLGLALPQVMPPHYAPTTLLGKDASRSGASASQLPGGEVQLQPATSSPRVVVRVMAQGRRIVHNVRQLLSFMAGGVGTMTLGVVLANAAGLPAPWSWSESMLLSLLFLPALALGLLATPAERIAMGSMRMPDKQPPLPRAIKPEPSVQARSRLPRRAALVPTVAGSSGLTGAQSNDSDSEEEEEEEEADGWLSEVEKLKRRRQHTHGMNIISPHALVVHLAVRFLLSSFVIVVLFAWALNIVHDAELLAWAQARTEAHAANAHDGSNVTTSVADVLAGGKKRRGYILGWGAQWPIRQDSGSSTSSSTVSTRAVVEARGIASLSLVLSLIAAGASCMYRISTLCQESPIRNMYWWLVAIVAVTVQFIRAALVSSPVLFAALAPSTSSCAHRSSTATMVIGTSPPASAALACLVDSASARVLLVVAGLVWPLIVVLLGEMVKVRCDRRKYEQRMHGLRLVFDTRLGQWSPV